MSFSVLPLIGIVVYFFLGGVIQGYVEKKKIEPSKAFWLGFWYPILIFVPLLAGSYIYRKFNAIHYDQEYLIPILCIVSVGLGIFRGVKLKNNAIEVSGAPIPPKYRV